MGQIKPVCTLVQTVIGLDLEHAFLLDYVHLVNYHNK